MKKLFTVMIICLSLCSLFASCGDNENEESAGVIVDDHDEDSEQVFVPVGSDGSTEEIELGGVPLD